MALRYALEMLRQDLGYGFRTFRRDTAFTAVALLTLALGIGANTAIFSIVNAVLLKPLPFPASDKLVVLDEYRLQHGSRTVSWMDYLDWRAENRAFDDMAAYRLTDISFTGQSEPRLLRAGEVSSSFFPLLSAEAAVGRVLDEQDDRPGAAPTVVISHNLWKTQLGGRPEIVGQSLRLNGVPHTIVGILPAAFSFFDRPVDIYLPVGRHGGDPEWLRRGNHPDLLVLARLRQDTSMDSARTALNVIMRRLENAYPQSNTGLTATVTGLYESRVGNTRTLLLMLFGSVGCVLLIACANVANLLMSRSVSRSHEFAIRIAIGAGRWRLGQQLIVENTLLSLAGGVLGIGMAMVVLPILVSAVPGSVVPAAAITVDTTVLVFALAVSVATGLLFGGISLIHLAGGSLNSTFGLSVRGQGASRGSRTARSVLVACEIAVALLVLTSAGLLIRSLATATRVNPGFDAEHVLALEVTIPPTKYVDAQPKTTLLRQAVDRLKAIPGVRDAGAVQCPPLSGVCVDTAFTLSDQPVTSVVDIPTAASNIVAPGYFETMHAALVSGRFFSDSDNSHGRLVAVVNQSFAAHHWPQQSAIGKRVREGGPQGQQPYREVVGVVADMKQNGLDVEPRPEVFLPVSQFPFAPWTELNRMTFVVRTDGDPLLLSAQAKRELLALDKDLPVTTVRALGPSVMESLARRSFSTSVLSGFAVLALLLAAVGTYGVLSYDVAQRASEIGVRRALGASTGSITALVLSHAARPVILGIILGCGASVLSTRWLVSQLFGVGRMDPATFVTVAGILLAVGALASIVPLRRALAVDPSVAFRS